jgi:predicted branched-subunit amino acid permease
VGSEQRTRRRFDRRRQWQPWWDVGDHQSGLPGVVHDRHISGRTDVSVQMCVEEPRGGVAQVLHFPETEASRPRRSTVVSDGAEPGAEFGRVDQALGRACWIESPRDGVAQVQREMAPDPTPRVGVSHNPACYMFKSRLDHVDTGNRITVNPSNGWRPGLRVGAVLGAGSFLLAVTFGAFAVSHRWHPVLTVLMSTVVFSGSAQFALVAAFAGGGGAVPAVAAASLVNLRFVPMAASIAGHLHGGPWRRAAEGQAVVDGSWVAAQRPDGGFDRTAMIAASLVQWPMWVCGTAIGAFAVPTTSVLRAAGLDLVFAGFFVLLLFDSLASRWRLAPVAVAAAAIAGAACYFLPNGVALLAAASAVLLTFVRWGKRSEPSPLDDAAPAGAPA